MQNRYVISTFVVIITFMIILTSGCIHLDLGKPFQSEEPEPTEYQIVTKEGFPITHTFDTLEDLDPTHSDTQPIRVKKGTEWVNISISVVINDFQIINNSPLENYTLLDRYVEVIIEYPNKDEYYRKRFEETDDVKRQLSTPAAGPWVVKVEAVGLGYGDTHDSYRINVIANEPV